MLVLPKRERMNLLQQQQAMTENSRLPYQRLGFYLTILRMNRNCFPMFSYFGIVPKISDSNETESNGRITKLGCKLGRTTLAQCTLLLFVTAIVCESFMSEVKLKKAVVKQ